MRIKTFEGFVSEEEHVKWLIEGLLPSIGWSLFAGESGVGKSTFAVQVCVALTEGRDFIGLKVKNPCRALFIQADSPTDEWREIIRRLAPKSKALTMIDVPANCLDNAAYVQLLQTNVQRGIHEAQVGFVVFDSLYKLTSIDVNSKGVLKAVDLMNSICGEVPYMLIHHLNKTGVTAGHHVLAANCSNHYVLSKTGLKVEKGRLVKSSRMELKKDHDGLWIRDSIHEELSVRHPELLVRL